MKSTDSGFSGHFIVFKHCFPSALLQACLKGQRQPEEQHPKD